MSGDCHMSDQLIITQHGKGWSHDMSGDGDTMSGGGDAMSGGGDEISISCRHWPC